MVTHLAITDLGLERERGWDQLAMGFDHGSWVFSYGNTKSNLPQTHKPRWTKITTHHRNLPPEIATDLRERHWYEREKRKRNKDKDLYLKVSQWWFELCVLCIEGFEKEKIEGFDRLWVSKRKKKHKKCFLFFLFLSFSFFFLKPITYKSPQFFLFLIPSTHKTQNPNHHWLIFTYKSPSLFLFLFLSHIGVSLLD